MVVSVCISQFSYFVLTQVTAHLPVLPVLPRLPAPPTPIQLAQPAHVVVVPLEAIQVAPPPLANATQDTLNLVRVLP